MAAVSYTHLDVYKRQVSALMGAAYGSCGERCMAISVAVCVGDQIADALVEKIVPQIQALKIGAGTSCGLDMGPLVTAAARDKVKGDVYKRQECCSPHRPGGAG